MPGVLFIKVTDDAERSVPLKEKSNVTVPIETGGTVCHAGPQDKHQVWFRRQKMGTSDRFRPEP